MVCSKKPQPKVAALNKELQKGIERQIFGLLEGYIVIENLKGQFFNKHKNIFKTHGLKLSNGLYWSLKVVVQRLLQLCAVFVWE